MKLKSITLKNWQKHSNLHLDFYDDLNIISGKSEAGKSCIRRAISWILFNANISEQDYRKEGTKETSVIIKLDNDFEIERVRTNSINRYILRHNDFEDKVFDSFGKNIPDEIKDIIDVEEIEADNDKINLNISEQLTLPFLLDKSATFRSKLFNKLTGNEILDSTFKKLNKEHLKIKRDITGTEEDIVKQEEQLGECSDDYKKLNKKLNLIKTKYNDILDKVKIYENLKELSDKLTANKENKEFIEFKKSQIKSISEDKIKELKEKALLLEKYVGLSHELKIVNGTIHDLKKQKENIKIVDIDLEDLKIKNMGLGQLKNINERLLQNIEQAQTIGLDKKVISDKLKLDEDELKEIWSKCKVCPLCKKELKNE